MKFVWDKQLKPNTKVKLITKKHRHFTSVPGKVVSHKGGELIIKGKDGKEYIRHEPQRIFLKEKSELDFPVKQIVWQGIPMEIENPAGSVRSGQDRNGHKWSQVMQWHYGRIPNTEGLDGDMIDVYVNPKGGSHKVFKIHTKTPDTGEFDESKYVCGAEDATQAEQIFRNSYDKPEFFGYLEEMPFEAFKRRAMKDQLTEMTSFKQILESIRCPVCGDQATDVQNAGSHKGFKGAAYTMKVYKHPNKECVYQTAYYPDYFGKGPKTVVHKWTEKKTGSPDTSQPTAKCPKCGGDMTRRKGPYGEFLGCKNYPNCKGAKKITELSLMKSITEAQDLMDKLLIAHESEAKKKGAKITNLRWGQGEDFIHSKTDIGPLYSEIDPKTKKVTHEWTD